MLLQQLKRLMVNLNPSPIQSIHTMVNQVSTWHAVAQLPNLFYFL